MKLLGLDFETTGLSFTDDRIIEIGAVLWDTELRAPMRIFSALVLHPDKKTELEAINGISQKMLEEYGDDQQNAFTELDDMAESAAFIVAHNGSGFDKPMMEASVKCFPMPEEWTLLKLPWIDTCQDLPIPDRITTRKLTHLAAEHGFLNPFAHRAVFDVLTMLKILDCYPLDVVLENARQPMVTLQACVSYEARKKASDRRYFWKPETKQWLRHMKAHHVGKERLECGFLVKEFPFVAG